MSTNENHINNKKATWPQALFSFSLPFIILLLVRWIVFEPYVIPSGSMLPNLLINDHIFVNKWIYGLRLPFSEKWLFVWSIPKRGDIVVFKYPRDKSTFFVKRVVGLPGDTVQVKEGQLIINNKPTQRIEQENYIFKGDEKTNQSAYLYYLENLDEHKFISRNWPNDRAQDYGPVKVPENSFFMVGDNRDESSDSRVWGYVPLENLMGRVSIIWLSCENKLPSMQYLCDPNTIRWSRIFKGVQNY
jgi:signal peptidase I